MFHQSLEQLPPSDIQEVLSNMSTIDKKGNTLFICLQYFQQGTMQFLPQSLILTYSNVPSYNVLSIFEATKVPWAMKFILAPFLEIYTYVFYGKRKFWMILSGILMAFFMLVVSFFTTQSYQIIAALIFVLAATFSATSDIATDGVAVKDLRNPEHISFIQATSRKIGSILGGFIFLKLVLPTFGKWIGLSGSIIKISTCFQILAVLFIVPEVIGHFLYKQEILQEQIDRKDDNLWSIIKQYKVFFQSKKKYFRTGVLLMFSIQGLLFFSSSYQFELMKKGFSKQRINQITTVASFPILVSIYYFSKIANQSNMYKLLGYVIIGKTINYIIAYIIQPQSTVLVIIYLFLDQTFNSLYDVVGTIIVNYFPVTAISGMMITMLNSWKNLGGFASLHLIIVGIIGHRVASLIGFVLHIIFLLFGFNKIVKWVQEGEVDQQQDLNQNIQNIHNIDTIGNKQKVNNLYLYQSKSQAIQYSQLDYSYTKYKSQGLPSIDLNNSQLKSA